MAAARILAELVGLTNNVILVNLVTLLVRVDERVVSNGTEVNHHRSYVLHGVPPLRSRTTTKPSQLYV
jgi:hypothetical protein